MRITPAENVQRALEALTTGVRNAADSESRVRRAPAGGHHRCRERGASSPGRRNVTPCVVGLHRSDEHRFSKEPVDACELVAGVGIVGDAHAGPLVQHRSRVAADPRQPNLRQVHLIAAELFDVLAAAGHHVEPGDLGENITTQGLDVHALAAGTMLAIGDDALVAVTGLRNPCPQIERFQPGLLAQVVHRDGEGSLVRRAGIMGVVIRGGAVHVGDRIAVSAPPGPPRQLERV